jgi:hypothetical protein
MARRPGDPYNRTGASAKHLEETILPLIERLRR